MNHSDETVDEVAMRNRWMSDMAQRLLHNADSGEITARDLPYELGYHQPETAYPGSVYKTYGDGVRRRNAILRLMRDKGLRDAR